MCIINSQKITVAYKCYQQTTVKVSCHFTKYNILYKNNKLARSILVKIVNHTEKCQTTDYIFFLASYQCHTNKQKFAQQYVTYFIPIFFLRKCHLLIDKQKDHISIKFTASLIFFLARACQHKTSKIGITILSLFQLKIVNIQKIFI